MRRAGAAGTALPDGAGGGTERAGGTAPGVRMCVQGVGTAGLRLPRDFPRSIFFFFSFISRFLPCRRPGRSRSAVLFGKVMQRWVTALPPDLRPAPACRGLPVTPTPRAGLPAMPPWGAPGLGRRGRPRGSAGPPGVSPPLPPVRVYLLLFATEPGRCSTNRRLPGPVCHPPVLPEAPPAPGRAPQLSRPGLSAPAARSGACALSFPFSLYNSYPFLIKTSLSARF